MRKRGLLSAFDLIVEAFRTYPARSLVIVGALLLAGLAEGLGVAAVLPVLGAILGEGQGAETELGRAVMGLLRTAGIPTELPILLALVVAGFAIKAGLLLLAMQQVGFAAARISTDLRFALIRALLNARWAYYSAQPAGTMANALTTEASHGGAVFLGAYQIVAMTIQVAVYVSLALLVSWEVTVASLVAGAAIILVMGRLVGMTRRAAQRAAAAYSEMLRRLTDALAGIKPLKAMAAQNRVGPLLEAEAQTVNLALQQTVIAKESMKWLREPILVMFLAIGLFAVVAVWQTAFEAILVMALLFHRIVNRVAEVQGAYQQLVDSEAYYRRITEKIHVAEHERETFAGQPAPALVNSVRLNHVSMSFGDHQVLDGVSLSIPAGQMTTLFGPSGVGKTTLADLLLGFYRPETGAVLVDDIPLAEIDLLSWRRQIGYVPQETFLFHDTILNNVTLGDPEIGVLEATEALQAAEAWDFVHSLPDGIRTVVGERGSRLSGGQRQRISIARALARQPRLLILDEPTTALDPATEAEVCATLKKLAGKVTILAISHQDAVRNAASVVYRLSSGKALSEKTPDTEMAASVAAGSAE